MTQTWGRCPGAGRGTELVRCACPITSGGTVPGAISDVLASGVNSNVGGWMLSAAATEIEEQLVRWLCDRFGLPAGSGGMVVQGGSLANLTAMKLARDNGIHCIVSHRSGETNDGFIADLALAFGAYGLKAGAPERGERVAKYDRLMHIIGMGK